MGFQVDQNDRKANTHHLQQVLCHFELSTRFMANLVSKNGCFWAVLRMIVLEVQDDRWCVE